MVEVSSSSDVASKADEYLKALVERNRFSGSVLIARNGNVLVSAGYGLANNEHGIPNTPQTKFRLGSVTKQFTAMAILILQDQGRINVQDPIAKIVPYCPETWEKVTIRHLLNHTSGIPEHAHRIDWTTAGRSPHTVPELVDLFRDRPLDFQPGEDYRYSNSGYVLLGQAIEQVSGLEYEAFLKKHVLDPLDMENTGYDRHNEVIKDRATGYDLRGDSFSISAYIDMSIPYAAGGLYSTVEDLLLWDQALYTDRLVPKKILDTMFLFNPLVANYGYGMEVGTQFNRRWVGHGGSIWGFLCHFMRFPADKLCIAVLTNLTSSKPAEVTRTLAAIVYGKEYDVPEIRTPIPVELEVLKSYEGQYRFAADNMLEIAAEVDRLIVSASGGVRTEFFPETEMRFFRKSNDDKIIFARDETGMVTELVLLQQGIEEKAERIR